MKKIIILNKIFLFLMSLSFSLYAFGQDKSVSLDALQKILGIGGLVIGVFISYITLKTSNKIQIVEAKFNELLNNRTEELKKIVDIETEKLELRFNIGLKDIRAEMASKHDIDNMRTLLDVKFENVRLQIQNALRNDNPR